MAQPNAAKAMAKATKADEWEPYKVFIKERYVVDRWPLWMVQQELERKGFYANIGQYRTRLGKWGIRKIELRVTISTVASTGSDKGPSVGKLPDAQNDEAFLSLSASSKRSGYADHPDEEYSDRVHDTGPDRSPCYQHEPSTPLSIPNDSLGHGESLSSGRIPGQGG